MSEVIYIFNAITLDGVTYNAQVVGRKSGHIWEGWIEFESQDGADVRRTRRETTQPNRAALKYWASGLSRTYLEGALRRALEPLIVRPRTEPDDAVLPGACSEFRHNYAAHQSRDSQSIFGCGQRRRDAAT